MLLIQAGAHVNIWCDVHLQTPLMAAALLFAHDMMRELLQRGALVTLGDKSGTTALHFAVFKQDAYGTALLITANANPNAKDLNNRTPLHLACMQGGPEVIRLLKAACARSDITDSNGDKPADYARKAGHGEAIVALVNAK